MKLLPKCICLGLLAADPLQLFHFVRHGVRLEIAARVPLLFLQELILISSLGGLHHAAGRKSLNRVVGQLQMGKFFWRGVAVQVLAEALPTRVAAQLLHGGVAMLVQVCAL